MKSTVRAFVAIEISLDVRRVAKKKLAPLQREFPDVKWIDDDNFHVTLKFLGPNVPVVELHKLIAALKRACRSVEQFDLVFEGLGAFPDATNPRTIWIGVTDGVDELRDLATKIDVEFGKLGYPVEGRAFSPHLTIARSRRRDRGDNSARDSRNVDDHRENVATLADRIDDFSDFYWGCCPVDRVVLYSSELERNGAKYEPLASIELAPIGVASLPIEDNFVEEDAVKKTTFDAAKKTELDRERDKLRFTPRPPRNAKSNVRPNDRKTSAPERKKSCKTNIPDLSELDAENLEQILKQEIENAE